MELQKMITRGKELSALMTDEHKTLLDRLVDFIMCGDGDMSDVRDLEEMVEAYDCYRQLGEKFIRRNHVSL